jgi:hypothetical protein
MRVRTKKKKESRSAPQVGIIFFFDHKLWIESTPVQKAAGHGNFKDHDGDHVTYWDGLLKEGKVPEDEEYQNVPRGRVVFHADTGRYHLLLDRCILRRKSLVATIISQMGLPANATERSTDFHYRCADCLPEGDLS